MIDLDKVNLLLSTLKYRIGPTGRERQAKIDYNFRNIVNTLLPGLHRYFLVTAFQKLDIFKKEENSIIGWAKQLFETMKLNESQNAKLIDLLEEKMTTIYKISIEKIQKLE